MRVIADENIPYAKEAFSTFGEVETYPGRTVSQDHLNEADILLVRSVTTVDEKLLEGTPVKFVASATIGIDHIDVSYLKGRNIGFAYAPGSNADSVAEYIMAALYTISGKISRPLSDMTLGIIGVGNIGSRVFKHATTLGLTTLLCDPPKKRLINSEMYRSLEEVLAGSDIVTFHVPLIVGGTDRTERMIDKSLLSRMKKGAVLINTSRGRIADEPAIIGHRDLLGGLVLDVWNNEPSINNELVAITDIATPHIAGYSFNGKIRGTKAMYEAACAWFFIKPTWTPPEELLADRTSEIEIGNAIDPIGMVIQQAYRIKTDDANLKKILQLEKSEQGNYFDNLRKKYPRRLEFPHYSVKRAECPDSIVKQLRMLGFSVV